MSNDERICGIALTLCQGIGHIMAKRLVETVGSAAEVFRLRGELAERHPGQFSSGVINALSDPSAFRRAEKEMEFAEKNRIECLVMTDERYPSRLRECEDAPLVLFFKGNLNRQRLGIRH